MSRPATGKPRRRSGNERYRQGFLSQAATELREFALLLTEEPDAQESVAFEPPKRWIDGAARESGGLHDIEAVMMAIEQGLENQGGGIGQSHRA